MRTLHEETWTLTRKEIAHPQHLTHVIVGPGGVVGAVLFKSEADLAVAAPEMARALRLMLEAFPRCTSSEDEANARQAARDALVKAGVPLP